MNRLVAATLIVLGLFGSMAEPVRAEVTAEQVRKAEFDLIFGRGIDYIGELIKLSVLEQKVLARVRLGAGIRFCAIDAASDTLFVGNFFTGALTALDRKTLQPKWSRFLGARLRNVSVFPLARKLVAASALGLFEIKLP